MPLTKSDIDALVGRIDSHFFYAMGPNPTVTPRPDTGTQQSLLRALYLAAGLTADGQRKPERVRCWMTQRPDGRAYVSATEPNYRALNVEEAVIPGWFVPDSDRNLTDGEGA